MPEQACPQATPQIDYRLEADHWRRRAVLAENNCQVLQGMLARRMALDPVPENFPGWSQRRLIVSRHAGAVGFIEAHLPEFCGATWAVDARPDDVRGVQVAGNLPLPLASLAACVWAVEFTGTPPRGREYTAAEMEAAGAVLRCYEVRQVAGPVPAAKEA